MSAGNSTQYSPDETGNVEGEQSQRAQETLEHILGQSTADEIIDYELSTTSIEEERRSEQIIARESDRERSRILFITKDTQYLEEKSAGMLTIKALSSLFDEVHVMVLLPLGGKEGAKRVSPNLWVYKVRARYWWQLPNKTLQAAHEQLSFAAGFRADIIVALDPFESGLAAERVSRKFDRPFQVHVTQNFFSDRYRKASRHNKWRARMAKRVLKRAHGVRTETTQLAEELKKRIRRISDVRVMPQFHNFKSYLDAEPAFNVHERYKDMLYLGVAFGPLTADSHLHDTFSALNSVLHNPRIGLIVVGGGPAKKMFEEKTELLGIEKNVIFLPEASDLVSLMKTADVLIQTDTTKEGDGMVLRGAAAGIPMVMYKNDLRADLFEDGVSASLCEKGDVHGIEEGFRSLLNNSALRTQYKAATRNIVETRLEEDEGTYYRALRDSIEITLNTGAPPTETEPEIPEVPEDEPEETGSEGSEQPEDEASK